MKYIDIEKTKSGNASLKKENVKKIMYLILLNKIANVGYYLKSEFNIKNANFNDKLKLIKEEDPEFYNYYIKNIEENKKVMKENIKRTIIYISKYIEEGIKLEDSTYRKFDLYDLYKVYNKYFYNLNRKELKMIIEELRKEGAFFGIDIYNIIKLISIFFYSDHYIYNRLIHRDEILYSEKLGLTAEEAKKLVEYMEENKVLMNYSNYVIGREKIIKERDNQNDLFKLDLNVELYDNKYELGETNYILEDLIYIINNKIINIKEFAEKEKNTRYENYKKKMKNFEKKNPEIYNMYKNDYDKNYDEFKKIAKIVMIEIARSMKKGIKLQDGTYRNFDIFDFYKLKNKYLKNLGKKALLEIFEEAFSDKTLDFSELNCGYLRILISSTCGSKLGSYEALDIPISEEIIIKMEDDLDVNEKEKLINFMKENNVPFTLGNYTFGTKKMISQRFTNNDMFNLEVSTVKARIKRIDK